MDICFLGNTESIITRRWIDSFKNDFEVSVISLSQEIIPGIKNYNIYINKNIPAIFPRIIKISETDQNGILDIYRKIHFTRLTGDILEIIKNLILKSKPKILHAHYLTDYGFIASTSGKRPLICQAYGSDVYLTPWQNPKNEKKAIEILEKSNLVVMVAKTMKDYLLRLGCDEEKIKYVPICTDVDTFDPKKLESVDNKEKIVLSFRRLNPLYNITSLVKSVPKVLEEFPDAKFIIASRGTEENKLKDLCKSLGVGDSVKFIGEIPYSEMPGLINKADICVSTALSDGTPNSVCESMAMEKPVIATSVGDVPYMIKDGETGILISPKSPNTLADKIIYLLKNDALRKKMGKNARKFIIKNYNWKRWRKVMKRIYIDFL